VAIIGGRWSKRQWLDLSASLALDSKPENGPGKKSKSKSAVPYFIA